MPTNYIDGATIKGTDYEFQDAGAREALETKAEIDGYYEQMTVGDAEQLIATQFVEDSEPYKFRTTGGSADVGNRAYADKIVGGTIAWNQLWNETNFFSINGGARVSASRNGTTGQDYTVTSEATGAASENWMYGIGCNTKTIPSGNKILFTAKFTASYNDTARVVLNTGINLNQYPLTANTEREISVIKPFGGDQASGDLLTHQIQITSNNMYAQAVGATLRIRDIGVFDLTQMFGSAVADAIYAAEQANTGAGVAWFRSLFPESYYAYNAGELISVSGLESKITVGFNAYNPATGKAELVGGKQYQITGAYTGLTIDGETVTPDSNGLFTPTGNGKIELTVTGGNDSDTCVHLVWSGQHNDEYEPYVKHAYPLDSSLTLRGIPMLDAENNLYYDGDEYLPDGTVTRKYGIATLNGSETWTKRPTGDNQYYTALNGAAIIDATTQLTVIGLVTNKYIAKTWGRYNVYTQDDKTCALFYGQPAIIIRDLSYNTVDELKSALASNPLTVVYELAIPTTETAEAYQPIQLVDDWGTEEYVSGTICPVGHETRYPANLRDKLQYLPNLASADGYYVIQQTDSQMSLVHFRIPQAPTTDGTYILKATVSGGTPTYIWESEE